MTVTVTGASGFVGHAVVAELRRRGVAVVAVSRRDSRPLAGMTAVRVDDYAQTPSGDTLIHLAEPREVLAVDEVMARRAAETFAGLAARFRTIVYASSAAIYGDATRHPRRCDEPVSPSGPYGRMKQEGEKIAVGRGGAAIRLANLYGPGMARNSVMSEILTQLGRPGPLLIRDGAPIRDFLWVDDAARGMVDIATAALRGIFNLGTGIGVSIGELARQALAIAGEAGRAIQATAAKPGNSVLILDPSGTTAACGWTPRVDLVDGLGRLIGERR